MPISPVPRKRRWPAFDPVQFGQNVPWDLTAPLLNDWIQHIEAEPYRYILVRTEELDWMCSEGELEERLHNAFKHFDQLDIDGEWRLSNTIRDLAVLWNGEALNECESFALVGSANGKERWPPRYTPLPDHPPKRPMLPWWAIWRSS